MAKPQHTKRVIYRYVGDVQGIGFRANAIHQARGLAIVGFVRNEANGDVTMDIQGPAGDVDELARRVGSSMNRKINETLIDEREPLPTRDQFRIQY
jgi:acylphosphatase